jgi:3-hydroxybutyryl-CoA dehydrogenase
MAMSGARTIAICGAGLMGHGIALSLARAGHRVHAYDPDAATRASLEARVRDSLTLLKAGGDEIERTIDGIDAFDDLGASVAGADYVFEAAPEQLAVKQKAFAEIEAAAPAHCIFASNTSVIPITSIMGGLGIRARALGTHWWNPPHLIPLVEVIRTEWTSEAAMEAMVGLLAGVGKQPVRVEKDIPGFVGNRLQHALWREAVSLVENGVCSAEAVDAVIRASFGRRLAVLGPLENADLVGTDLTLDIHENVLFDLESRRGPSPYLRGLVAAGKLGVKTGEGFMKWPPGAADQTRARVVDYLLAIEALVDAPPRRRRNRSQGRT